MAGSLNKVTLIGNFGADPEVRNFNNGGKVCNFRIACTEKWKDKQGQKQERTEWVSVAIFQEGLIRICEQYLKKGSSVYLEGKLQTRKWQDQSGNDRYSTEVVLQGFDSKLVMLDGPKHDRQQCGGYQDQGHQSPTSGAPAGGYGGGGNQFNDEIPFNIEARA